MSHLAGLLAGLRAQESALAASLRAVARAHADEPEVFHTCCTLAEWSEQHTAHLAAHGATAQVAVAEPALITHEGGFGGLRDLQDLYAAASHVKSSWTLVSQCAQALRDSELEVLAGSCSGRTQRQLSWLTTQLKSAAVQAILATT